MVDWAALARDESHETFPARQWVRVTRRHPCPVCKKPDWCLVDALEEVAICMRVMDGAARELEMDHGRGYLHELVSARSNVQPLRRTAPPPPRPSVDWNRWQPPTQWSDVESYATKLGVYPETLERLGACRLADGWGFPMFDAKRQVIGIRLRLDNGRKLAVTGSRAGLFIPRGLDGESTLLIAEGPTDAAAALSLGFAAIGRPSCSGGTKFIRAMLRYGKRRPVVILEDDCHREMGAGTPGRLGAESLAEQIHEVTASVKILRTWPHKDFRVWCNEGNANHFIVKRRIDSMMGYARTEKRRRQ